MSCGQKWAAEKEEDFSEYLALCKAMNIKPKTTNPFGSCDWESHWQFLLKMKQERKKSK